ncbi:MAG: NUDIX hydrolase N-terminal domain-containing protein [Christensenellales bacterium]|nr:hypothetical protein [Clostridiales bacterium]
MPALFQGVYDIERFARIRKISALMLSALSDTLLQKVEYILCCENCLVL